MISRSFGLCPQMRLYFILSTAQILQDTHKPFLKQALSLKKIILCSPKLIFHMYLTNIHPNLMLLSCTGFIIHTFHYFNNFPQASLWCHLEASGHREWKNEIRIMRIKKNKRTWCLKAEDANGCVFKFLKIIGGRKARKEFHAIGVRRTRITCSTSRQQTNYLLNISRNWKLKLVRTCSDTNICLTH